MNRARPDDEQQGDTHQSASRFGVLALLIKGEGSAWPHTRRAAPVPHALIRKIALIEGAVRRPEIGSFQDWFRNLM